VFLTPSNVIYLSIMLVVDLSNSAKSFGRIGASFTKLNLSKVPKEVKHLQKCIQMYVAAIYTLQDFFMSVSSAFEVHTEYRMHSIAF
jgi:hypothetical protein